MAKRKQYDADTILEARLLQERYIKEMRAAWRQVHEATQRKTKEVNAAQRRRDKALRAIGVNPNDLSAMKEKRK